MMTRFDITKEDVTDISLQLWNGFQEVISIVTRSRDVATSAQSAEAMDITIIITNR